MSDIDCFVVDDCSDPQFYREIEATVAKYPFATLSQNEQRLGPRDNFLRCLTFGSGVYIKVLQHDDVLMPGALKYLAAALDKFDSAVMATSPTKLIDGNGAQLPDEWWNSSISKHDVLINGRDLIAWTIQVEGNPIGPPAASLLRRAAIDPDRLMYVTENVERAFDVAAWLAIAPEGDVAYISQPLTAFRLHNASLSGQRDLGFHLSADWGLIVHRAMLLQAISPEESARAWERYFPRVSASLAASSGHVLNGVLHDRVELASAALCSDTSLGVVLSDGTLPAAIKTAQLALGVLDEVVVLERSAVFSGHPAVSVIPCDWEDEQQLAATLSAWPDVPLVLLAPGERLVVPNVMRARAAIAAAACTSDSAVVHTQNGWDVRALHLGGDGDTTELPEQMFAIRAQHTFAQNLRVCPLCGASPAKFTPLPDAHISPPKNAGFEHPLDLWEMLNVGEYECSTCFGSDRERAMWLYAEQQLAGDVLDIAPSKSLANLVRNHNNVKSYTSADAHMAGVDDVIDIRALPYADNSFDWVFCSHVLEHVDDDIAALSELFRVLRPGGRAVLLTPISLHLADMIEDGNVTDPAERLRRFGQSDHIRIYTADALRGRIKSVGFHVETFATSTFGTEACTRFAIPESGKLYVAFKTES